MYLSVFHSITKELVFGTKSSTGWGWLIWTSALNFTKPLSSLSRASKVKLKKKSTPLSNTLVNYCRKSEFVLSILFFLYYRSQHVVLVRLRLNALKFNKSLLFSKLFIKFTFLPCYVIILQCMTFKKNSYWIVLKFVLLK